MQRDKSLACRVNLKEIPKSDGVESKRLKGRRAGSERVTAPYAVCLREHVIVYYCESREIVSFEWFETRDWCDPSGQQRRNIIDVLFSPFLSLSFFLTRSSTLVARSVNCFPNSDTLGWDYVHLQLQWYIDNTRHATSANLPFRLYYRLRILRYSY